MQGFTWRLQDLQIDVYALSKTLEKDEEMLEEI